jgi:Tfp pilus assembly protein PilN
MLKRITYGKTYNAIEHSYSDGIEKYSLLTLKEVKKEFIISNTTAFNNLENCISTIDKKQPVLLVVNNKNTISKVLERTFENTIEAAKYCFPTIQINDFYIEVSNFENSSLITVCRKEIIDTIVSLYQKENISIVGFSLGNSMSSILHSYFDMNTIKSSNTCIEIDEKNTLISSKATITKNQTTYDLKGLQISSQDVLNFGAILSFYTSKERTLNFKARNKQLLNLFFQKRLFFYGVRMSLFLLFSIVLFNSFFFMEYQQKISVLEQEVQFANSYETKLVALKNTVQLKKELVANLTKNSNSKVSFYLDELAMDIPSSILLTTIRFQPIIKKVKEGHKILFDTEKIIISGTTKKAKDFNNWMHILEARPWVKTSSVVDYGTGKETKTSFTIYLFL